MEARRLSSIGTFFVKFVFPAVLFLGAAVSFLVTKINDGESDSPGPYMLFVVFLASLLDADKKSLKTDGEHFFVSNYIRTEKVACTSLQHVAYRKNAKGITITLTFEPRTSFGNNIAILSPLDFQNVFSMLNKYVNRDKLPT